MGPDEDEDEDEEEDEEEDEDEEEEDDDDDGDDEAAAEEEEEEEGTGPTCASGRGASSARVRAALPPSRPARAILALLTPWRSSLASSSSASERDLDHAVPPILPAGSSSDSPCASSPDLRRSRLRTRGSSPSTTPPLKRSESGDGRRARAGGGSVATSGGEERRMRAFSIVTVSG